MTPYEGLQLSQLMDLMHDLVRPEPVVWTPQTIGWAVIVVWALTVVAILLWHSIRRWRRNRYRREALQELKSLQSQQDLDEQGVAAGIATILKRTALAAYDRPQVADLYGQAWADFLCESAANDAIVRRHAVAISNAAYAKEANGAELFAPVRRWIKVHRA
ncbi:MAG: DUF4381 domain-containing protein [Woeseiaceae bacterium]